MSSGRYLLILNPDIVLRPDTVEKLMAFVERTPDAGIVGPRLVFHDGSVQLSCRRFYTFKVLLLRRTPLGRLFRNARVVREHLMLDFDHATTCRVDWILGAAMFVRREAIESVGMMDERFFLYFEDVDWCYRMRQNGLKVYYCAGVEIVHGYARESAQRVMNRSFVSHLVSLFRYYEKWNSIVYVFKKYREVFKSLLFVGVDLASFNAAFLSAYYLRVVTGGIFTNPIFPISAYQKFLLFENLLFLFSFLALGLYRIRRQTRPVDELFDIGRAIAFASILLMTSTYLSQIRTYSRMVVAFVVPFAIAYDWIARSAIRRVHRKLLELKVDLKRACIVGSQERARELEVKLTNDASLGIDVVGVVETQPHDDCILTGTLGNVDDIERIVDRYRIQHVIVLPGTLAPGRLAELVSFGRRRVLDVTLVSDHAELVTRKASVSYLSGRPVIAYPRDTRYAMDRLVKRIFDVFVGTVFVVVSIPFYMVYSLYALSRGRRPFTFGERMGLGGRPFTQPTAGDDVPVGPSDFVNLPLFWLVVIGKMSLVGPYPLPVEDAGLLLSGADFRFDARPGITGFWRSGRNGTLGREDLLAQDADYIRNWTLTQDFKILLTTVGAVIRGRRRRLLLLPDAGGGRERNGNVDT